MLYLGGGGGVAAGQGAGFGLKPKTVVKCLGVGHHLSIKYSIHNNNYTLILHWLQDYNL